MNGRKEPTKKAGAKAPAPRPKTPPSALIDVSVLQYLNCIDGVLLRDPKSGSLAYTPKMRITTLETGKRVLTRGKLL